jgi:hypothetical protein
MCENHSPPPLQYRSAPTIWPSLSGFKRTDTVMLSHGLVIGIPGFHSSATSSPSTPPLSITASLKPRVSVFSFLNRGAFFGRLSLALLVLQFRTALLLANCHESSYFIWPSGPPSGCLGCCPLGWQPDSPLALSLRLLASAELFSTGPASLAWSTREPSDLSGLDQGDPLGLLQDVPWALSRIP